jgi:hypothetical protein
VDLDFHVSTMTAVSVAIKLSVFRDKTPDPALPSEDQVDRLDSTTEPRR